MASEVGNRLIFCEGVPFFASCRCLHQAICGAMAVWPLEPGSTVVSAPFRVKISVSTAASTMRGHSELEPIGELSWTC